MTESWSAGATLPKIIFSLYHLTVLLWASALPSVLSASASIKWVATVPVSWCCEDWNNPWNLLRVELDTVEWITSISCKQVCICLKEDHLCLPLGPDNVEIRLISFVAFHLSQPGQHLSGLIFLLLCSSKWKINSLVMNKNGMFLSYVSIKMIFFSLKK